MNKDYLLNEVKINTSVEVENIECSEIVKRRILDLGIIKGTNIKPIFRSPLGDPTAYEVRGSVIAIRKEDAKKIKVKDN